VSACGLLQVGEFGELVAKGDGEDTKEGDDRRNKEEVHGEAPENEPVGPVWDYLLLLLAERECKKRAKPCRSLRIDRRA